MSASALEGTSSRRRAAATLAAILVAPFGCAGGDDAGADDASAGTTSAGATASAGTNWLDACEFIGTGGYSLYDVALRELDDPPEAPRWRLDNATCETDWIHAIDITPSGVICAAGHRALTDDTCDSTCPLTTSWIRCFSPGYEELWARSFDAGSVSIAALITTPAGEVVIAGARHDQAPPAEGYDGAPWIAAFDPAGSLLWEDAPPWSGALRAVDRGDDGTLIAVGDVLVDGDKSDLFAAAYSPEGAELWTMTEDSAAYEAALGVAVDELGRSWIVGARDEDPLASKLRAYSLGWGGTFRIGPYFSAETALVALVDADGALQWIEIPPTADEFPFAWAAAVAHLPGGGVIVGGARKDDADSLARYDADGALLWTTTQTSEGITALRVDEAGDVFAVGSGCGCMLEIDPADGEVVWKEPGLGSDAFALSPAGEPVIADYIADGWFYPPWSRF